MNFRDLTPYHKFLLCLYIIVLPLLIVFSQGKISYTLTLEHVIITLGIFILSTLVFLISMPFLRLGKIRFRKMSLSQCLFTLMYGLLIAFPEEIFFRGIIQGRFQSLFMGAAIPVFLSSVIFGAAHLPNG